MAKDKEFKFYENFMRAIDILPEEQRAEACYKFCRFGIYGELPEDERLKMFCIGVSVSVQKYQNCGGNHNPTGKNQHTKNGQVGQVGQVGQDEQTKTETETETETEKILPEAFYGKYKNVYLTAVNYRKLEVMAMSKKKLYRIIDKVSESIEALDFKPYDISRPNEHFEILTTKIRNSFTN